LDFPPLFLDIISAFFLVFIWFYNSYRDTQDNRPICACLWCNFNLCAEEYFFYLQGYIHPEVWKAWENGMKYFLDTKKLKKIEKKKQSRNPTINLTLIIF
jgi:hypothetical protein